VKSPHGETARIRNDAANSLYAAVGWAEDRANQMIDDNGFYYWASYLDDSQGCALV